LVVAACAHRAEAGVLHYDSDYDVLADIAARPEPWG
jgi:hypothetical protein